MKKIPTEFLDAVRQMRHLQKEYFAHRNYTTLSLSKAAERKVDKLVDEADNETTEPKLFPEEKQ